jgi:hypothetical protein
MMVVEPPTREYLEPLPTSTAPLARDPWVLIGVFFVVIGMLGAGWWALQATFTSGMGTTGDRTVCEAVAVLDPVGAPDTWACIAGPDGAPVTIYEGSEEAILDLETMAADLYQADLRLQWLYPSAGFVIIGLGAWLVGTRRESSRV